MIDPSATMDREEADECRKMHEIIERHNLKDCFRWIVAQARAAGRAVVRCWHRAEGLLLTDDVSTGSGPAALLVQMSASLVICACWRLMP